MNIYRGNRGTAPLIRNILFTQHSLNRRLGGSQGRCRGFGEENNSWPCPNRTRTVHPVSLVTTPTALPWPLQILKIIFKVTHKFLVKKFYERHQIKKTIFQLQHTAVLLAVLGHKYRVFKVKTQPLRNTLTYSYRGYIFQAHAFIGAHF